MNPVFTSFFRPWRPLLVGWLLCSLIAAAAAMVAGSSVFPPGEATWIAVARLGVRMWLPWTLLAPLLFRLARRYPIDRARWKTAGPLHLLSCFVALGCCSLWREKIGPASPVVYLMQIPSAREIPADGSALRPVPHTHYGHIDFLRLLSGDLPTYFMIVGSAHALLFFRRDQERAHSLAIARLEALRMQLQPHFLFNTLNAISALITRDPARADAMLVGLSGLLRHSLQTSDEIETPLADELAFCERFLDIIHLRFEERLCFSLDVAPETRAALVPPLLLQPLLENAVRHGLRLETAGGKVTVRAWREDRMLRLTVADNGAGLSSDESVKEGIGLGNTRARLSVLYGNEATLELRNGTGLVVDITLPFHTSPASLSA